jgi:hypothetical protein
MCLAVTGGNKGCTNWEPSYEFLFTECYYLLIDTFLLKLITNDVFNNVAPTGDVFNLQSR